MNTPFYKKVYEIVKQIPVGKVLTYQDVARLAGSPGASRAVGTAMKNNPDNEVVPCHRVVGSDGSMHGYAFGGVSSKFEKLTAEGVVFKGQKVDLTMSRWKNL
jgi:methylated-DNA-protein-cysteine methyltransferase related protein